MDMPTNTDGRIEFVGPDDKIKYVVRTMKWLEIKRLETKHTKIVNINQGNITFDNEAYVADIYMICTTKDGKPLTKADLDNMDSKTGAVLEMAVNQLNFLSATEIRNLQWVQL